MSFNPGKTHKSVLTKILIMILFQVWGKIWKPWTTMEEMAYLHRKRGKRGRWGQKTPKKDHISIDCQKNHGWPQYQTRNWGFYERKNADESWFGTTKTRFCCLLMFRSSHFLFLVFGHFWRQSYENTKILHNLCLHFARQDGQDRKKGKKITQLKWPKYQKYPKIESIF